MVRRRGRQPGEPGEPRIPPDRVDVLPKEKERGMLDIKSRLVISGFHSTKVLFPLRKLYVGRFEKSTFGCYGLILIRLNFT